MITAAQLITQMLNVMATEVLGQARRNLSAMATDSRTAEALRNDLRIQIGTVGASEGKADVLTDFYWALYYHDGRGPVRAKPGKFLVFFRNPDDDPRIGGSARNYPKRAVDAKPLTLSKDQFHTMLRAKKLIATKRVGPADAHPFFEVGFRSLQKQYGPVVRDLLRSFVLDSLREDDLLDIKGEAHFEL